MSKFELATLPQPLAEYFGTQDHAATAHLFALDAVVRDEGETHSGREAIAAWLASVEKRYHPRYVVQGAEASGDRTIVHFEVSGTFPGSPANLRQAFALSNDLIRGIETL